MWGRRRCTTPAAASVSASRGGSADAGSSWASASRCRARTWACSTAVRCSWTHTPPRPRTAAASVSASPAARATSASRQNWWRACPRRPRSSNVCPVITGSRDGTGSRGRSTGSRYRPFQDDHEHDHHHPGRVRSARRALPGRSATIGRAAVHGCRWAEGPVYFPPAATSSSATSPTTACCAGTRPPGSSASSGIRRATPTATRWTPGRLVILRAGQPPGRLAPSTTARSPCSRTVRGPAAEQPQRRRRPVGRLDLVHRPVVRHRQRLRRAPGRERDRRLPRLPGRSGRGEVAIVADDFIRPNGLAFSARRAAALRRRHPANHIRRFDVRRRRLTGG